MREKYKIINKDYKINPEIVFELKHDNLRGNSKKIHKQRSRPEVRKQFFSNRAVDAWNDLDENIVNAKKWHLIKYDLN